MSEALDKMAQEAVEQGVYGKVPDLGWLALSSDESREVARAATYQGAVDAAAIAGESDPVLLKIYRRIHLNKWVENS